MSNPIFSIWCNHEFPTPALEILRDGISPHRLILATTSQSSSHPPEAFNTLLGEADIALGQPDPDRVMSLVRLRWIHLTSAGYTNYDRDDFRAALRQRSAILTNSSSVYDKPCALHVFAMMTALARQLPAALESQQSTRSWHQEALRAKSSLLNDETVLILGFGSIARRLVQLLEPLRMNIIGVRRQVTGDEPIRIVLTAEVERYLGIADHVVNILPANPSTKKFLNAARLAAIKPGAILYNIGRGTTVDQDALVSALHSGHLAAAYLDVTDPEPLPADDPLWTSPNCYITPHTAGGHRDEMEQLVRHFLDNLHRFTNGERLIDRII